MPLVTVDSHHEVDFHILDTADIARHLPRKLVIGTPGCAHGEEGEMGDCLGIRCDSVVLLGRQRDKCGFKTREDLFDKVHGFLAGAVVDDDERLAFGVDAWAVERVTGYDLDIGWEVLLKGGNFWGFGGGLAANDGAHLCAWAIPGDNGINVLCFNTIHDPVTTAGHVVAVLKNCNILLEHASAQAIGRLHRCLLLCWRTRP